MADSRRHAVRRIRRWLLAGTIGGGLAALGALYGAILTLIIAKTIVTPPRRRAEDTTVLSVDLEAQTITLSPTPDALVRGEYSFWFAKDAGHARVGDMVASTEVGGTITSVTRRLLTVDFGDITAARTGRFSGWFYLGPADLGIPFSTVTIDTEIGEAPAWLFPADEEAPQGDTGRWAILVHGRAVRRQEALRSVDVFRSAGYTCLIASYRNDEDAAASPDGRYGLGDTEWRDIDAALRYALAHGATDVVLMGYSMGGATVLQTATRSGVADVIRGIVLESPVVDWITALRYQAGVLKIIWPIPSIVLAVIGGASHRLTGQSSAIDLRRLNFVARAAELTIPVLVLHSRDDGYIPITASRALAEARPDIVTFAEFEKARHTKLWNYDPERFNREIATWLGGLR